MRDKPEIVVPLEIDEPVQETPVQDEEPVGDPGFTDTGRWYEHVNYQCKTCPFDSLELERIQIHVYQAHILPPE